jgi:hypothetical protein
MVRLSERGFMLKVLIYVAASLRSHMTISALKF